MTTREIVAFADTSRVVITGGEPTIYNLDPLMLALYQNGAQWIQLETSGQNELKGKLVPNWVTWSPKRNLNFETNEQIMSV
jgi:organic radical activating enzyme